MRIHAVRVIATVALVAGATACSRSADAGAESVLLRDREGRVVGRAIEAADGWTYYLRHPKLSSDSPLQLLRTIAGGKPEAFKVAGGCSSPYLSNLDLLPGGLLGATEMCVDSYASMVAIDVLTRTSSTLVGLSLHERATVSDTAKRDGWIEFESSGCWSIAPFVEGKRQAAPKLALATVMGRPLDVAYNAAPTDSCGEDKGQIGFIAARPGGVLWALASPPPASGAVRHWVVYKIDTISLSESQLAAGFQEPNDMAVSLDGNLAVVSAKRDGKHGLWAVDVSGRVQQVAKGDFKGVGLSQDGDYVLATKRTVEEDSIVRFKLR